MDKVIKAFEDGYNLLINTGNVSNGESVKIVTKTERDMHVSSTTTYNMKLFTKSRDNKVNKLIDFTFRGDSSPKGLDMFHAKAFFEIIKLFISTNMEHDKQL